MKDSNVSQHNDDLASFRRKSYPTLATIFVGGIFLFAQFALYISGGLVLFNNVEVQSIFASTESSSQIALSVTNLPSQVVATESMIVLDQISDDPFDRTYTTTNPEVILNEPIPTNIKKLTANIISKEKKNPAPNPNIADGNTNTVGFQLSINKEDWYFFHNGIWTLAPANSRYSNTLDTINQNLNQFKSTKKAETFHIKLILISDGNTQVGIRDLMVEK